MYNEQLDFSKPKSEGSNYFIYNINAPNLQNNYINDLNTAKVYTSVCNEQKQPCLPQTEQLNYKAQPGEPIFPIETPTPLFYNSNVEKQVLKKRVKKVMKKKGITTYNRYQSVKKKGKNKKKYSTGVLNRGDYSVEEGKGNTFSVTANAFKRNNEFNANITKTGLFDPNLKKNELDYPSRTQKQRIERMQKIKKYNEQFGKKSNGLQMCNNYLDVLTEEEKRKMAEDYLEQSKSKGLWKYSKEHKEQLLEELNVLPKQKVIYNKCNLDFNFSNFEKIIQNLQDQILYERKLRTEANMKYLKKLNECENMTIEKLIPSKKLKKGSKITKRAKSVIKIYSPKRKKWNDTSKNKTMFKKKEKEAKEAIKKVRSKSKQTEDEKFRDLNREITRSAEKIMDRDFNRLHQDIDIKKNRLINKNFVTTKNIQAIANKIAQEENNKPKERPTINLSHFAQLSSSYPQGMEDQLVNEILYQENAKNINELNKYQLLTSINNSVNNYSKVFPIMINKVNEAIDKIGKVNMFDETTHPIIKLASRATGRAIQDNIEELSNALIDDMLVELVYDLQFIEDCKTKSNNKKQFLSFLSGYFTNVNNMKKIENEVVNKLSNNQNDPYSTYQSLSTNFLSQKKDKNVQTMNPFDEIISNSKFNQNLLNFCSQQNTHLPYKVSASPKLLLSCEEYQKRYLDFMLLNGSFYYPNIFGIYDQAIKEMCAQMMDEEIGAIVQHIDEATDEIYDKELKQLQ